MSLTSSQLRSMGPRRLTHAMLKNGFSADKTWAVIIVWALEISVSTWFSKCRYDIVWVRGLTWLAFSITNLYLTSTQDHAIRNCTIDSATQSRFPGCDRPKRITSRSYIKAWTGCGSLNSNPLTWASSYISMGMILNTSAESLSEPSLDDAQPVRQHGERDPHVVPTFTRESLCRPSSTVIYLPPLLSSLPQNVTTPPISVTRPPLATETRLPDIDPVSLSLHNALHHFGPLSDNFAALPYNLAFNWSELELPEDEEREWYAVVFRSRRKKGSDSDRK